MNFRFFCLCIFFLPGILLAQSLKKKFTLIIDPGHGGEDPGAYGYGGHEKNIALSVAKKLVAFINLSHGDKVKVIYTRDSDKFIRLKDRADIANKHQGDLFISIHCNSSPKNSPEGTETFVLNLRRSQDNFDVIKRENSVVLLEPDYKEDYSNIDASSPESFIGLSMLQNLYLQRSIQFASLVQENFQLYGRASRGVKQGPFLVLREVAMPSVLIELGFNTNRNEGLFMISPKGQSLLAWSIYKAFVKFFEFYTMEKEQEQQGEGLGSQETLEQTKEVVEINPSYKEEQEIKVPLIEEKTNIEYPIESQFLKENTKEILYKIQLFSLSKEISLSDEIFKGLSPIEYYKEEGLYKYTFAASYHLEEIEKQLDKVKFLGFSSAFIIGLKDNKKLDSKDLNAFLKK